MKIGNVEIPNRVILAPMAGVGNSAYRRIVREMGCGLVCCEMVSDKAIYYGSKKTIDMLYMMECERPISQQIFGSDEESFVNAAKFIEKTMHPDIIDINMGCPVPKVALRSQAGSALLKDIPKIKKIVSSVVNAVSCPVTVKIRSGWDSEHINALEVAKAVEESGASAICIHPRTRAQGYSGKADWSIIKKVKEKVNIPVIGNGDIKSPLDAKRMLEETGCDFVMIGRAAIGNPWIFKQTVEYLDNNKLIDQPTNCERIDMCFKHLNYLLEFQDEKQAVLEIRMHIAAYLKGIEGAKKVKDDIFKTKNVKEIEKILLDFKKVC